VPGKKELKLLFIAGCLSCFLKDTGQANFHSLIAKLDKPGKQRIVFGKPGLFRPGPGIKLTTYQSPITRF